MQMTCPKCHGQMRQYERSGVTVDQCTECRGIFLDRGELEKISEAENAWNRRQEQAPPPPAGRPAPPPPAGQYAPPPPPQGYPPAPGYGHQRYHGHYHGHYGRRRRRGFLGELFD
jgi:Zn-finger nucleic acid-binding protein